MGRELLQRDSESQLISLQNEARASAGMKSLKLDTALRKVARWRSKDMIQRDYFSHTIKGTSRNVFWYLQHTYDYCFKVAGENIGTVTWKGASVEDATNWVFDAFMNSSGHRANIMGKAWDVVAVGRLQGFRRQVHVDGAVRGPVLDVAGADAQADPEADAQADRRSRHTSRSTPRPPGPTAEAEARVDPAAHAEAGPDADAQRRPESPSPTVAPTPRLRCDTATAGADAEPRPAPHLRTARPSRPATGRRRGAADRA